MLINQHTSLFPWGGGGVVKQYQYVSICSGRDLILKLGEDIEPIGKQKNLVYFDISHFD